MTTEVGSGRGLIGYQPAVLPKHDRVALPDETAIVVYRDEASYQAIRATPVGQRYGKLHFKLDGVSDIPGMAPLEGRDFFVPVDGQGNKSGSAVAKTELDNIAFGNAYVPVYGAEALWQSASTLFRIHVRKPGVTDEQYLASITAYLKVSASGQAKLPWHVVRVEKNYVLEYCGMADDWGYGSIHAQLDPLIKSTLELHGGHLNLLDPLADEESRARQFAMSRGTGYRLQFGI